MDRRVFLKCCALAPAMMGAARAMADNTATTRWDSGKLGSRNRNRSDVIARHAMACTSQPLATEAAIDVMKAGGNAVDAAVAANAVLGVVEPMSCGPGGDLFAIVWMESERRLFGLNASGRSPRKWTLEEAQKLGLKKIPSNSPLAWNVPGCVSGWDALLQRFGTRPFKELAKYPIMHAREGFPVSPVIARDWRFLQPSSPTLRDTFYPTGRAPEPGSVFTNERVAKFYELLANEGLRAFYEGAPAEKISAFAKEQGAFLEVEDFGAHQPDWVEPVSTNYRGYDVWEIPPNGQGIAALQMLNMLETFDIASLEPNGAQHMHLFTEAKKLAFEDRAVYYADQGFADVPLEQLISKDYGRERAKLIDPNKANAEVKPGALDGSTDTIYLTTADAEGNMVSLIQSLYAGWGSQIAPGDLGICIQNRGESFALDPAHRNKLEGGKRPFHTIIPAFITKEGRPYMSYGVMGGDHQPQGHVQVALNHIDFGMSPQQAGEQPRADHSGSSDPTGEKAEGVGTLRLEQGFSEETVAKLTEMGHKVKVGGAFGGFQGILRSDDPLRYTGGSDPRKDGCAFGY